MNFAGDHVPCSMNLTNKDIGRLFDELAQLMELHGENEFKIRSYANAGLAIRKMDLPLLSQSQKENEAVKGIGKSIAEKIEELKSSGTIVALESLRSQTPEGVREMLRIKGLGPKKLKIIWHDMNIENPGELLYACQENRLLMFTGFGLKTQEEIMKNLLFFQQHKDSFLLSQIIPAADALLTALRQLKPEAQFELTGEARRWMPVCNKIHILCSEKPGQWPENLSILSENDSEVSALLDDKYPVKVDIVPSSNFGRHHFMTTGGSEAFMSEYYFQPDQTYSTEAEIFEKMGLPIIPAECRDMNSSWAEKASYLIEENDIRGVVHAHSKYSDGMYSLREMAMECIRLGYEYLVISDHSKTAAYAGGLQVERVLAQRNEIDTLNIELKPFKIFKSIESDILSDGALDYESEVLQGFDLVIASIHSQLNMTEEKAMNRLLRAIENPYTSMLGHPTGRLLLSRKAYPVDHKMMIDHCAAHGVCIEINANPMRLDLDWQWLEYATSKNVKISINPDAHNLRGITDIHWGVKMARKAGLSKADCINTLPLAEFDSWVSGRKNSKHIF